MIASGLEAHIATVDLKKLPAKFAGRTFDVALLADLPEGVDACGENGEFHTCVVAGPMFSRQASAKSGEHTSELPSQSNLGCRLLLGKKKHPVVYGEGSALRHY